MYDDSAVPILAIVVGVMRTVQGTEHVPSDLFGLGYHHAQAHDDSHFRFMHVAELTYDTFA